MSEVTDTSANKKTSVAKKIVIAAACVIALLVAVSMCSGSETKESAPSEPYSKADSAPEQLPLSGRDGKFEFTVTEVSRGNTIGDEIFSETAKGEFVTVHINVKNVGDEQRTFSSSDQKLYVGEVEYSPTTLLDDNLSNSINPGLSSDVQVSFDVPVGTVPTSVKLHDSFLSNGVMLGIPEG